LTSDESDISIPTGAFPPTAQVMLTGRLPGHAELGGDLRPPDAEFDGMVDQCCEFGLSLLLRIAGAPDPLQH
jgi:hypothetical protein